MIEETVKTEISAMSFQGTDVRAFVKNEDVWFCVIDVCNALQIKQSRIRRFLDEEDITSVTFSHSGLQRKQNFVSESGLYTLIMRSNSPLAKPFQRWVTHEVLPTIRKTGAYAMPGTAMAKYQENLSKAANKAYGMLKFRLAQIMYNDFFTAEEMHAAIDDAKLEIDKGMALNYDAARWDCGAPQATRDRLEGYCGEYGEFKRPSRLEAAGAKGFLN